MSNDLYLMLIDLLSEIRSFGIMSAIILAVVFLWTSWIYFNIWLDERVKTLYAKRKAHKSEQEMGEYLEHQFDRSKK